MVEIPEPEEVVVEPEVPVDPEPPVEPAEPELPVELVVELELVLEVPPEKPIGMTGSLLAKICWTPLSICCFEALRAAWTVAS